MKLDEIRAKADAKYLATEIDLDDGTKVLLLNPLRLDKAGREKLSQLQNGLDGEGVDQLDVLRDMIRIVAGKDKAGANKLLAEVGEDLAVLTMLIEEYTETAAPGEASASQS